MHPSDRPKFTYLGHSTVLCTLTDGRTLLIDPWVESNPSCPENLKQLDRVDAVQPDPAARAWDL